MLSTRARVEPPAQQDIHKNAVIGLLLSGDQIDLVFREEASCTELVGLQQLEAEGIIALSESTRGAISLLLTNKQWGDLPNARTFRLTIRKPDLDQFRRHVPIRLIDDVTKVRA